MSLAIIYSRALVGISAPLVTVEVHISNGLPRLSIVGLPETAVKESKDRVHGAIINSRYDFPLKRIIINLAPADLPKEGGRFDLPIAIGILAASRQITSECLDQYEFVGELALSGELRAVRGVLPVAMQAQADSRSAIIPTASGQCLSVCGDLQVFTASHLLDVCAHINKSKILTRVPRVEKPLTNHSEHYGDLSDIRGQQHAKRALEIAAAGSHSLLMSGPPGTGKSMLAMRLPGLLPAMTEIEAWETAAILSINNAPHDQTEKSDIWYQRPFRSPHHTASANAMVGGGSYPRPGEISLAHNGVLFLDELPEFNKKVIEVLREPMESGKVTLSRAACQVEYNARFQFIAAMNPCPCGYLGDDQRQCQCSLDQVSRYRSRISGPLLDRIDMHINVLRLSTSILMNNSPEQGGEDVETSAVVRVRVKEARNRQLNRSGKVNSVLSNTELDQCCQLDQKSVDLLCQATDKLGLSARAYNRVRKLARTVADLEDSTAVLSVHIAEAISYCRKERRN